jgi:hypothetical protein
LIRRLASKESKYANQTSAEWVRLSVTERGGRLEVDDPKSEREAQLSDQEILLGRVYAAASLMTQSTPGLWRVLYSANRNMAWFVCIVECAIALMHRRDDVRGTDSAGRMDGVAIELAWMAQNRAERPDAKHMERIRAHFEQLHEIFPRFATAFQCEPGSILGYKPANEVVLRRQNNELIASMRESTTQIRQIVRRHLHSQELKILKDRELIADLRGILNITESRWPDREDVNKRQDEKARGARP